MRATVIICWIIVGMLNDNNALGQSLSQITGTIQDVEFNAISYANVLLGINDPTRIDHFTMTDEAGRFALETKTQPGDTLYLNIRSLGYQNFDTTILVGNEPLPPQTFTLRTSSIGIAEFTLTERAPPVIVRGDSTTYDADSFTSGREQNLRDVLKKLPGVEVDRNNNVTVNGKPVDRITVENENFFGRNKKLALDRLPADVVGKLRCLLRRMQQRSKQAIDSDIQFPL